MILSATRDHILLAAQALQDGELVVLPTETVYGLAASINDKDAISYIFQLKGRPDDNPLIVHLHDEKLAERVAANLDNRFYQLANRFWPGPLSIVVQKQPTVSDSITAGGNTVALRIPDHPVALGVMSALDLMLAMPSANPFMSLSPTRADLVSPEIANGVWGILDGGPCSVGIESTVLDLTSDQPTILRQGVIGRQEIEDCLSQKIEFGQKSSKSPGQYRRHYAPRTKAIIVEKFSQNAHGISFKESISDQIIHVGNDPLTYARNLYASLAELDGLGLRLIEILRPPESEEWSAVWDRLTKATTEA